MSSYPVLDNKPIDQWKVTELKEELKRRKLKTNGLKDDLIRRLYESIQNEVESANENSDLDSAPKHVVESQDPMTVPVVDERTTSIMDKSEKSNNELKNDTVEPTVYDDLGSLGKEQVLGGDSMVVTDSAGLEPEKVIEASTEETSVQVTTVETSVQVTTVETSHRVTTVGPVVGESLVTEIALSGQELQNYGTQNKNEDLNIQPQNEDSNPPHEEAKLKSSDLDNQVFEVSNVTSDSIFTDNVSINEKIELKDNIIADDVKLEFDVKPEMEEPSSSNVVLDDGNLQPMDVEELQENKVKVEETGNNADNQDIAKKISSEDVGLSEKLNLDRSSGDDSLEEDALESKQIESKSISDEVGDKRDRIEVPVVGEDAPADATIDDLSAGKKVENKNGLAVASMKRKLHGHETVGNSDITKRQRRWNSEGLKVLETQSATVSPSTTPRAFQSTTPRDAFLSTAKPNFSRSDSTARDETPKERVVPPSPKPPTNSLRIDRFLRPFTLKAVQELLGKTGTVTNFWMDHIKTHCYVSYSSVEEAIESRNAVYNLQWPKNGGRLLVADFVEPQEVQMRVDAPPSPAAPVSTAPALPPAPVPTQPQPSPRLQVQRQVLPPLSPTPLPVSLPPPPPLSNPVPARERALPLPPPLPEKVDPPIVTLDDLFRKTKATPRIYYLPLSDEQVAAKQNAQGRTTKQ